MAAHLQLWLDPATLQRMAAGRPPVELQNLNHASETSVQLQALRSIKCDLNGHVSRKVAYIRHGLVSRLAELLHELMEDFDGSDHDDVAILTQVSHLICIIAHGAPQYHSP
jgi:hypothetical protein